MLELELVAVQIEEAGRLAAIGRVPHLRLAFLLLDNAVEVMLRLEVRNHTLFQDVNAAMARRLRDMQDVHGQKPEFMALLADIESRVLSDRKIESLEREFGANASFLADRGKLDPALATIARKLHRYRNDLYHHLQLRREVLEPATHAYFDVACSVLATWSFQRSWSSGEEYEDLTRFGVTPYDLFEDDVTDRVASRLRVSAGIDLVGVRTALIDHLNSRLDELEEVISEIRAAIPGEYDDPVDVFRIVQSDWAKQLPPLAELRQRRFQVSERTLRLWRRRTLSLANVADRYAMYARYAEVEDSFEKFERQAIDLHEAIEHAEQLAIEEARGK